MDSCSVGTEQTVFFGVFDAIAGNFGLPRHFVGDRLVDAVLKFHIHLPHLHFKVRSVLDFALFCKLVRLDFALYAVSVRQTGILLLSSFRFHLTMDTLDFR